MSDMGLTYKNEKGMVLPLGLMFLAIIAILGTTAVIVTTTDLKIGSNYRASEEAFYAAEAGIEEARARLRQSAANHINDGHPTSDQWRAYIGENVKAQGKGYNSSNAMHIRVSSLQSYLAYVVEIKHQTDTSGNILYWGDPDGDGISQRNLDGTYSGNKNIYLVTSYGYSGTSNKAICVEMTLVPPVTAPAALYIEASTTIQGSSTNIIGTDSCGSEDKPGIITSQAEGSITENGNPTISGDPAISYNGANMDIQSVVDSFKGSADFAYTVNSATDTGMNWGTPTPGATLQDPSSCSSSNIVYYNTQNTYIKLSGGSAGCGILLVEGDLDMSGGFSWYGIVIVTGAITITGGGDKNITGALIAGGSVDADIVGGNSNIVYCSSAIDNQTENHPLLILSWEEEM
ncbi:MAG TPA: pilus assembly PilX N-terminal domain-containing protein [Anaerolineae bacterium]|nr:pilus assembly PilX N-terminal domain-containing protein [Anaerolineae bacterium]